MSETKLTQEGEFEGLRDRVRAFGPVRDVAVSSHDPLQDPTHDEIQRLACVHGYASAENVRRLLAAFVQSRRHRLTRSPDPRIAAADAMAKALEECLKDTFTASDGMSECGNTFAKMRYRDGTAALAAYNALK